MGRGSRLERQTASAASRHAGWGHRWRSQATHDPPACATPPSRCVAAGPGTRRLHAAAGPAAAPAGEPGSHLHRRQQQDQPGMLPGGWSWLSSSRGALRCRWGQCRWGCVCACSHAWLALVLPSPIRCILAYLYYTARRSHAYSSQPPLAPSLLSLASHQLGVTPGHAYMPCPTPPSPASPPPTSPAPHPFCPPSSPCRPSGWTTCATWPCWAAAPLGGSPWCSTRGATSRSRPSPRRTWCRRGCRWGRGAAPGAVGVQGRPCRAPSTAAAGSVLDLMDEQRDATGACSAAACASSSAPLRDWERPCT